MAAEVHQVHSKTPAEQRAYLAGWNARGNAAIQELERRAERHARSRRFYWLGFWMYVLCVLLVVL